ncbi:uncharacterized protein LOC106404020 isoform X4 [Brassica napus]|uniref:uncharacterized protein LOC106404020 isoform X4 n=1 Tax=Brassica napus TaxID=3708 RepID=UPI000BBE8495|nr:uncharacterized protein LOC106404020 isoform X4 [Brassica napus]
MIHRCCSVFSTRCLDFTQLYSYVLLYSVFGGCVRIGVVWKRQWSVSFIPEPTRVSQKDSTSSKPEVSNTVASTSLLGGSTRLFSSYYSFGLGHLKLLNKGSRLRACRVKWEDNNHSTDNNQTGRQQRGGETEKTNEAKTHSVS